MKGLLLAVTVENITTRKDHTVKITLGTQEISSGHAGDLFALMNKLAAMYLCPKEDGVSKADMAMVDAADADMPTKTPSQRLRGVLFKIWEQTPEGFTDFAQYYRVKMESIIEEYKTKIL